MSTCTTARTKYSTNAHDAQLCKADPLVRRYSLYSLKPLLVEHYFNASYCTFVLANTSLYDGLIFNS